MADPLFTPAVVGAAVTALLTKVVGNVKLAYSYRDKCNELGDRLVTIKPIVTKLGQSASKTKNEECMKWLLHFKGLLERAEVLTKECLQESRFDKTKRVLKFWRWKKLPSQLTKINTQIDKAVADAHLFTLDVVISTSAGESLGFVKQTTPPLIVGVEEQLIKLKTSILESSRREDKPSTFGLQGRGGAGKTLLAQMLNNDNDIKEAYGEDSIIWITVGLDASVGDLYERLGKTTILDRCDSKRLKLSQNKADQRTYLQNAFAEKKVLLILDDVWEKQYDHHDMIYWLDVAKAPGSTTLITTRNETILYRARAEVKVVLSLDHDDSWKLFCSHAFVNKDASLTIIPKKLARAVCEECKGLPLALKVIGSTMMDKMTIREWKLALLYLQQSTPILDSNVDDELFGRLQLSYEELKDDATKICFLYFAAFPEDHKIEVKDLISIWVGEELFGLDLTVKEAENIAHVQLGMLAKRSLIYWNQDNNYAHIHDILRDLALYIIDNSKLGECAHECLFHSEKTSISFPGRKCVVGLKRMSFVNCKISHWPEDVQIVCPEVKVCILQNTTFKESKASLDFFSSMTNLRVLNVSGKSFISQSQLVNITKFKHLAKLNMSRCDSLKKLPKSIGNLEHLMYLDLSNCESLTGLPESIGNLKCLTKLDLSYCGSLTELPKSIGNLKCLTKLHLQSCESLTRFPESIDNLKYLIELNLSDCGSLTGLSTNIGNLECLIDLDLSNCRSLSGLPENIGNLKCLTKLDLSGCESLTGLPESIDNLKCLTYLSLQYCQSLKGLPENISNFERLTKLNLSNCGSLMGLPESIGNLRCLTELDLSNCGSLMGLPESIGNLKYLTKLNFSDCGSLTRLPTNINNLEYLIDLDLSFCISLLGLQESISNLKCLTYLKLHGCDSLTALPKSIGNLTRLTKLSLSDCGFLIELPKSIGNLKYLTYLSLRYCQSLKGLPESIGNLKYLTELYLSNCGSLMRIPESIGNLESLTKLNLSDCGSLTGLPTNIGNLKYLTELYLSNCGSLIGLPEDIGNLENLTKLNLSDCESLLGLPTNIGNLNYLTELYLSNCGSLTGLPESIGNLKYLTYLSLRYCQSLMELPESIGNLKCLTELYLSNCGSLIGLPESIGNLENLTKLNLSDCESLMGLPTNIGNLNCLTELYLSNCGSLTWLPESINNLESLTKLNLSNCGSLTTLPTNIDNLEYLIDLDLSNCTSLSGLQESIGNLKCVKG